MCVTRPDGWMSSSLMCVRVHDLLPTHDLTLQTKAEEPLNPIYFKPGQSVWRSNALLLQDNWLYIVIVLLTCEYDVQAHSLQVHCSGWHFQTSIPHNESLHVLPSYVLWVPPCSCLRTTM
jgi:hypothetical protein